ncbi:hypothetical protein TNCV_355591 [Trichonephila clavipes]|nr:hypothetical protein TNCV_355591 [Trichonephila clavipes]
MPSPVQSNCDAHDTIANGPYGAVCSMGHTTERNVGDRGSKLKLLKTHRVEDPCRRNVDQITLVWLKNAILVKA